MGPILFNYFINDISDCFQSSEVFIYADDLKFTRIVETVDDCIQLQSDLNRLIVWCSMNDMILNHNKCHFLKFSRKHTLTDYEYNINQNKITEVQTVRDLCVIYDT